MRPWQLPTKLTPHPGSSSYKHSSPGVAPGATQPEAINLEDLMRLSVRNGLKMKKQSRSITSLQLHNSALFLSTTHYFSGNSSDTQLSEVNIIQLLPTALHLPLKEIKKKSISYSSKERQVFASLIKSNSAVFVLSRPV
jgi:hypothetical protein